MLHSKRMLCLLTLACLQGVHGFGQQGSATLSGVVTDPSGAVVPGATVTLHPAGGGAAVSVVSGPSGLYVLAAVGVAAGQLDVSAPGFAPYGNAAVELTAGRVKTLNVQLILATATEEVEVSGAAKDTTDPNNNGDSLTLKGHDLDLLPTDQGQLLQQLQGLSGGSAPELYVNGFSGGALPPKDSIREIRINQNPYSALNDTNPVNGRIEILTKPGSDKLHGSLFVQGNDSPFNSRNPFAAETPAYYQYYASGTVGGPINKRSSFFVNFNRESFQGNTIIDAQVLDANLNQTGFTQALAAPNTTFSSYGRYDASVGTKSTVSASYNLATNTQINAGIGQLTLASEAFNPYSTVQTLQLSNSQIVSAKVVNDTRFQYIRSRTHQTPVSDAPALIVEGAFNGGGNTAGQSHDALDRYELQDYWNAAEGKQYLTFGARLRVARDANESLANFNGQFTFATLAAYQTTQQGLAAGQSAAQIRAAGGGASQFSLSAGQPAVKVAVADVGGFFQDDYKLRPNVTLSGGLRFEAQTAIHDHGDFGPRLGASWGLFAKKNKPALYTLRGGAGLFFYRFAYGSLETVVRQNGVTEQQYVIQSPDFYPNVPTPSALAATTPSSIYQISPTFHAPYYVASTVAVDRRLGDKGTLSLSYVTNRGVHTQMQRNINAPLPGTYNAQVPGSGTRPLGGPADVFQFQSEGIFNSKRISANMNVRLKKLFFYGYYQVLSQHSDTDGGFPSNQYDLGADYGRAGSDTRQNGGLGGSTPLPFGFEVYLFLRASSGAPFNITVGQDLNGDAQYNDRPSFATDLTRASVVRTAYGNFDTAPIAGQTIIPRNYGQAPGLFTSYFNLSRSIEFGPEIKPPASAVPGKLAPGAKPQKPGRRYNLEFSVSAQNLTNHVSLNAPVGVLTSPLFGKSTALAFGNTSGNRVINLQTYFSF